MPKKSPDICPLGPELQKYWDKRYDYFSRFDEGIQIDAEGLYSVTPEEVGTNQASLMQGTVVLDGFAGVGGSAIAFARAGKKVISVDINPNRLNMARHNADIYGVSEAITFIEGDFFEVAQGINADTVNLDPPWGGPAYKELGRFLLEHFRPNGNDLLTFSLAHFNEIVIHVPLIFDMAELDRYPVNYEVFDDITKGRAISKTVVIQK
jgi:trimethylguanosine synthase